MKEKKGSEGRKVNKGKDQEKKKGGSIADLPKDSRDPDFIIRGK